MKKSAKTTPKGIILIILAVILLCGAAVGVFALLGGGSIQEVPSDKEYRYVNPDETKAESDKGFTIDGVLDEEAYKNNNWLYLHNDDGGNNVDIAMTSYYGEKGMYFVYDVTESVPIYVNLNRASYLNSCIEMYFAPSSVNAIRGNSVFEVDLLPTGDLVFKKSNGKGGYVNVATTDDIMAYLGTTTKGGPVNTEECYGYCLELFIPWEYMQWLGMDAEAMKTSYVYVNPAHITSNNLTGTDTSVDRYWYFYAQQLGASFGSVTKYFRFDGNGVLDSVPTTLVEGKNYTITGDKTVIPGMETTITLTPEKGYALTSILVNGEEFIHQASYNADGSVTLKVRATAAGVTVSAAAEPVTQGNKTLSGTVNLHKYGGDKLNGVLVTYTGPEGEKPVTLDANGKFALTDLKQGYYTIKVEKEGYTTIARSVYLNRDTDTELTLEYGMFYVESGTSFVLDSQNDGILEKQGGTGYVLTTNAYNKFTFASWFKYDNALAEESDTDDFTQQRTGMRIRFSNGKYWHIDLLKENDKYILQYAAHAKKNSVFEKWSHFYHVLTDEQVEQFTGKDGIKLTVVRDGQTAAVYLDDDLLVVQKLGDEYEELTVQLGLEAWNANKGTQVFPYSISGDVAVDVKNSYFLNPEGWIIAGQYDGVVSLGSGGRGNLTFADKYAELDLTLTVRDYDDPKATNARNDVLFVFDNGAHVSFGVAYVENEGIYRIQSLNHAADDGKQIYNRYTSHYVLTEEEAEKYEAEGVDFRIVRIGTEVSLYIDGKLVAVADLTNNNSGVKASDEAAVTIRHYDDAGVQVDIPFEITEDLDIVTVTCPETEQGKVNTNKQNYIVGDTVILSDGGNETRYVIGAKINGEETAFGSDGTYAFKADQKSYTVQGIFDERVFAKNDNWNLFAQNAGVLETGKNDSNGATYVQTLGNYSAVTLTLTDPDGEMDNFGVAAQFYFENDQYVMVQVFKWNGKYYIKSAAKGAVFGGNQNYYVLSKPEEIAAIQGEGLDLTVARTGTNMLLYLNDQRLEKLTVKINGTEITSDCLDLTVDYNGKETGITKDTKAVVKINSWCQDAEHTTIQIPFVLSEKEPDVALIQIGDTANGTITMDKKVYVIGETVTLTGVGNDGWYCSNMTVDGTSVALNWNQAYSVVAEKATYTVGGTFAEKIFHNQENWDVSDQNQGVITRPNGAGEGWLEFCDKYTDFDLTMTLKGYDETTAAGVRFIFKNDSVDEWVTFRIVYEVIDGNGAWKLKSMSDSIFNWKTFHTLNAQQVEKFLGEGIDFRVARCGTGVYLYLDGERVCDTIDLTVDKNNEQTGITADMQAAVCIRHYGTANADVNIPFVVTGDVDAVSMDIAETQNGNIVTQYKSYLLGDTVTLTGVGSNGWYCSNMTVDGTAVTMNWNQAYSFVTDKAAYTVGGTFAERVFVNDKNWDVSTQNQGVITLPNGGRGDIRLYNKYTDIDLTILAGNYAGDKDAADKYPRTDVLFVFDNGAHVSFGITCNAAGAWIQSLNNASDDGKQIYNRWKAHGELTGEEFAQFVDGGVELRLVRSGTNIHLYIGDRKLNVCDLTNNNSGVTADTEATVYIRHYDDAGVQMKFPFTVTDEVSAVDVQIAQTENGSITGQWPAYLLGDTVILTANPDSGYAYNTLQIDGTNQRFGYDGTYTFVAEKTGYAVTGSFAKSLFKDANTSWNLTNQHFGVLFVPDTCANNTGWIETAGNYNELSMTVKDYSGGAVHEYAVAGKLVFSNGKYVSIRLIYNKNNGTYALQSMGDSVANWGTHHTLTAEQAAKVQGDGIVFRMTRIGTTLNLYLDDVLVKKVDLTGRDSGITADMTCFAGVRYYNFGYAAELPFTLGNPEQKVNVNVADTANGTVTTDKESYLIGDTVTVTVKPNSGYAYSSLKIDGKEVAVDANGTCSFTATKDTYEITGSFVEGIFVDYSGNSWNLIHQNFGILRIPSGSNGAGWMQTKGNYNELSMTVKDYSGGTVHEYAVVGQLYFSNGKYASIRLIYNKNNGTYTLQSMGDSVANWAIHHTLTAEQAAKVQGDGIVFRMTRIGTTLNLYLDDVLVKKVDLTGRSSGITADMSCVAKVRCYNSKGYDVELPFTLGNPEQKVNVNVADTANGTITTDKESYLIGDTVTVTVKPNSGYAYSSLKIDGKEVAVDANGTCSFVAAKDTYEITGSFEKAIFIDNSAWYLMHQLSGSIAQRETVTGNASWLLSTRTDYKDVDITVTVKGYGTEDGDTRPNASRTSVQFGYKEGSYDYWTSFSVLQSGSTYTVVNRNGDCVPFTAYTLTADEVSQLRSDEGIVFRVVRVGTTVDLYLGDKMVVEDIDLTNGGKYAYITADTPVQIKFKRDDDPKVLADMPFTISENVDVAVTVAETANGTITTDQESYKLGDTVTVTVNSNSGYAYSSLKIDGESVIANWDGTYSFVATKNTYSVESSFAPAIFKTTTEGWNLVNQNVGKVKIASTQANGHSRWLDFADKYTEADITLTVREYLDQTGDTSDLTRSGILFTINGKTIMFSIAKNKDSNSTTTPAGFKYSIQSLGGNTLVAGNHDFYVMNQTEIDALRSEGGIDLRVVWFGTTVDIYLGGNLVVDNYDLTKYGGNPAGASTGVAEGMSAAITIRRYDDKDVQAEYDIKVIGTRE